VIDLPISRSPRTAQAVWLVLAVAATAAYALPLASQWSALQTICHPDSACAGFQLDATAAHTLSDDGLSMGAYAIYTYAVYAAVWVIWYGLAALIIWRKPDERGALLSAFFLILGPGLEGSTFISSSAPGVFKYGLNVVPFSALFLFVLLFPDGHFAPRWIRWLAVAGILAIFTSAGGQIGQLFLFAGVAVQIYRFRSRSSWSQRQQAKWAFFGLVVGILGIFVLFVPVAFAPARTHNGSLYSGLITTDFAIVLSAIPICIGIAVLRSRLWDIDRIISRALVYTTLSVTLVGIYIGSVIGLQALFRLVAGNSSSLAIALSTLAIAALFGPLRRRTQSVIDRRFYRSKYDAERTLAAFGERLRDEMDLTQLAQDLTAVVHATLHPEHVSLWLRDGSREELTTR
jgi:hypothetical protein